MGAQFALCGYLLVLSGIRWILVIQFFVWTAFYLFFPLISLFRADITICYTKYLKAIILHSQDEFQAKWKYPNNL
jgi:hypothetical protein